MDEFVVLGTLSEKINQYAVGHEVTEEQITGLCEDMKQCALAACETENERKSVKAVTQGNLLLWGDINKARK